MSAFAAAAAVLAAACSDSGDNPFDAAVDEQAAAGTTTVPAAPPLEVVWTTPGQYITRPQLVAGRIVGLVAQDGGIALVAHDPATGAEVWRRPSSWSETRPDTVLEVPNDGARVFHFTPAEDGTTMIEAVDVASGQPAWQTPGRVFSDPVDFCDGVSGPLCTVKLKSTGDTALWRIAPDTGVFNEMDDINGRGLGARLYDVDDGPDIARVVGGAVVWQRPETDLFAGAPVSAGSGASFREHGDMLVGALGAAEPPPADGAYTLPPRTLAGITSATGDPRWSGEGDPTCGRLSLLNLTVDGQPPWIRCRITGTVTYAASAPTAWSYSDVLVEGYDPVTGTVTWSAELGAASALGDPAGTVIRQGPSRFAVKLDDGSLLSLDLTTGETREPDPGEVGWCLSPNQYGDRTGHPFTWPCTLDAAPLPAPSGPDDGVGPLAGDVFVWMDANGLHGARIVP